MQFNIYSFFSRGNTALAADEEQTVPCHQQLRFYKGDWENRTIHNPEELNCLDGDNCEWPVFMAAVEGSNLRVVMVKRRRCCEENENTKLTTKPEDILPSVPVPSNVSYRKPPEFKSPCDDMHEEGKPPCALASFASPQGIFVVFLLIVASLIPSNSHWR
ncbi:uncharacterized protein LOC110056491 [Orbicella faveolata]|uniref:uncharacterized protein LOC110056491 n=1 Tax=Orbicella faveolata TaxID=48498 RepID=UPI0009E59B99|nr:uncharacterized protein LOC110056491 [Orbicella faveolata]